MLSTRINTYYLPTLELVLQDLAEAERKGSDATAEREALCIRAIQTISGILKAHQENTDAAGLLDMEAEVDALENMAALKGDLPSSTPLLRQ